MKKIQELSICLMLLVWSSFTTADSFENSRFGFSIDVPSMELVGDKANNDWAWAAFRSGSDWLFVAAKDEKATPFFGAIEGWVDNYQMLHFMKRYAEDYGYVLKDKDVRAMSLPNGMPTTIETRVYDINGNPRTVALIYFGASNGRWFFARYHRDGDDRDRRDEATELFQRIRIE